MKKPKVVWEGVDQDGYGRRIVAILFDGRGDPWFCAEKEGIDAMGKKIWVEWK
jgi:hypothetical protein